EAIYFAGWTWKCKGSSRHSCLNLGGQMNILKLIGGGAALLAMALTASANGVPAKTRSAYGSDGSPVQSSQSSTSDGVTIDSILFCSDATIDAVHGAGTCQA